MPETLADELTAISGESIPLGSGAHGRVALDPSTMIVTKRFHSRAGNAGAQRATQEFETLARFAKVTASHPFIRCPEPIAANERSIRMSYCPGIRLDRLLREEDRIESDFEHIAQQIAAAVEAFAREFGRPWHSLSTTNVLYDTETRTLSFVDFTDPDGMDSVPTTADSLAASLGCLVGTTTYHTVRPRSLSDVRLARRTERLAGQVLERLGEGTRLDLTALRHAARHRYDAAGLRMSRGRPLRRAWYATVGRAVFERRLRRVLLADHRRRAARNADGSPARGNGRVLLGRGAHGTVELDPASMLVRKRFGDDDATAEPGWRAQREFERLERLSQILQDEPFLGCPDPVGVDSETGALQMTYCPGTRLDGLLADSALTVTRHLEHIADQIARALELYAAEFAEPYYELSTNNMAYEPASRVLHVLDFSVPGHLRELHRGGDEFEVSVGNFLGLTTYHTVRPTTWKNGRYWKAQRRLSKAVLRRLSQRRRLDLERMRQVSEATFYAMGTTQSRGKPVRQAWYSTVGTFLFRRRRDELLAYLARQQGGVGDP